MVRVGSLNVLDELNGPATAAFDLAEATPHARGSTFARVSLRLRGKGYPACAGIDPGP